MTDYIDGYKFVDSGTSNDLIRRAYSAYFKTAGAGADQPSNSGSILCEAEDGKQYVVLGGGRGGGPLAVYRVRNDGVLKGLKRWPKAIENW